jgi:hypothetical protein
MSTFAQELLASKLTQAKAEGSATLKIQPHHIRQEVKLFLSFMASCILIPVYPRKEVGLQNTFACKGKVSDGRGEIKLF